MKEEDEEDILYLEDEMTPDDADVPGEKPRNPSAGKLGSGPRVTDMVKLLDNIDRDMSNNRMVSMSIIVGSILLCLVVSVGAFRFSDKQRQSVYILDHGKALLAIQSDATVSKDLEVQDHVTRFHEFFFDMAPNMESIRENLDKAYNLADKSAYDYAQDLAEKGYFNRMISANITQQIQVDSVKMNLDTYPYDVRTFARLYVLRESTMTVFAIESKCHVIEAARSSSNPHGLMIEGFSVLRNEAVETRKR